MEILTFTFYRYSQLLRAPDLKEFHETGGTDVFLKPQSAATAVDSSRAVGRQTCLYII